MNITQIEAAACFVCGETLTDPESISRGTGPVCASRLSGVLGAVSSSPEEIAALALTNDATVARWLRVFARAIQEGHYARARGFLQSARAAAQNTVAED